MKGLRTLPALLAALVLVATATRSAKAQESAPARDTISQVTGPNRAMLRSGLWTLGLGYVPPAVVAIESPLAEDDHLFIPVAGPWLDYAERDCDTCNHEDLNKALLVTDGVVQGIGALQIIGSLLFLETRTVVARNQGSRRVASTPAFRLAPAKLGYAYGVAATARF